MIVRPIDDWSAPTTLAADTLFQCQAGTTMLGIGADAPDMDDGFILIQDPVRPLRDSITLPAGTVVRWRRVSPRPTKLYYTALP